jgi:hypothetical protein
MSRRNSAGLSNLWPCPTGLSTTKNATSRENTSKGISSAYAVSEHAISSAYTGGSALAFLLPHFVSNPSSTAARRRAKASCAALIAAAKAAAQQEYLSYGFVGQECPPLENRDVSAIRAGFAVSASA